VAVLFELGPPLGRFGVGHEVQSLSDVRRAEARSANIERPEGVVLAFHVRLNKVEPSKCVFARRLFAKDDARISLGDESEPIRPKMSLVGEASFLARDREALTGTGTGPDFSVVGPSGEGKGVIPNPNPGEEMAAGVPSEISGPNIGN
jgi:hypothetical protein